jgi:hypothetical protein
MDLTGSFWREVVPSRLVVFDREVILRNSISQRLARAFHYGLSSWCTTNNLPWPNDWAMIAFLPSKSSG